MSSSDQTLDLLLELENFIPGWDESYLVAEAREALKEGMAYRTAVVIYGADIVSLAQQEPIA